MNRTIITRGVYLLILFGTGMVTAQKESNIWYFGYKAGLDFSTGTATPIHNSQMFSFEGSSSVCDANGSLLFYTDGLTIWNRNHVILDTGLLGNHSSTQGASIVKKPGSWNSYYIITIDGFGLANGIRYTEVDMSLNGGLGGVIPGAKNIPMHTPSTEKLTLVNHCNGKDSWIISHDLDTTLFRVFKVSASGIDVSTPIISNVGTKLPLFHGQIKCSPQGDRIAIASNDFYAVTLFDFDNTTGIVSNAAELQLQENTYGVEFSPDGSKLYSSESFPRKRIFQYDLCAGTNAEIYFSRVEIGNTPRRYFGALQLGPDGKIYCAKNNDQFLGVIHSPNQKGANCNYVDQGVSLAPHFSSYGLPSFNVSNFSDTLPYFKYTIDSCKAQFSAPSTVNGACQSLGEILDYKWIFGDPYTLDSISFDPNPSHTFSIDSIHQVSLKLNTKCGEEIIQKQYVKVDGCEPEVAPLIWIPEAFTPNNDGVNDLFAVKGNEILNNEGSLSIFNRWGTVIYSTQDIRTGWDGTIKNRPVQEDVYLYRLELSKGNKDKIIRRGSVSLLR